MDFNQLPRRSMNTCLQRGSTWLAVGPRKLRGSVLILVLWIVFGLVTVTLYFSHSMFFEYLSAENRMATVQAQRGIEGVSRYIKLALTNQVDVLDPIGAISSRTDPYLIGDAMVWAIGRDTADTRPTIPVFGLVDESAKLCLNSATQEMLEKLPNMPVELAAAIVDWRDEDDEISENGAESETYLLREPSYEAKNAPFESVEELFLLVGATPELLLGEDTNRNGILDPFENDGDLNPPSDNQDGTLDFGLLEYLTVYGQRPRYDLEQNEMVDLNNSDTEDLREFFETEFGTDRANAILENSGQTQYQSLLDFYQRSGLTADEFDSITKKIIIVTNDLPIEAGMINANTAPAEVLACLPGMDIAIAEQFVADRSSLERTDGALSWVVDVLDGEVLVEAGPYLTGSSAQYTADLVGIGARGRGYSRAQFVIDISEGVSKIVFRKEMSHVGWALGELQTEDLAQYTINP